jgi:hypothetical protein
MGAAQRERFEKLIAKPSNSINTLLSFMSWFSLITLRRSKVPILDGRFSLPNFGVNTFGFSHDETPGPNLLCPVSVSPFITRGVSSPLTTYMFGFGFECVSGERIH